VQYMKAFDLYASDHEGYPWPGTAGPYGSAPFYCLGDRAAGYICSPNTSGLDVSTMVNDALRPYLTSVPPLAPVVVRWGILDSPGYTCESGDGAVCTKALFFYFLDAKSDGCPAGDYTQKVLNLYRYCEHILQF